MTSTAHVQSPGVFSPWPSERPSVVLARKLFTRNETNLFSDWAALKHAAPVRSLLAFSAPAPPAPLVAGPDASVAGAITSNVHVQQRDALIAQVDAENAVRADQRAAAEAEIRQAFWQAIASALIDTAPLLL